MSSFISILFNVAFFFLGNKYFPEYIQVDSTKTLIAVIVVMIVVELALAFIIAMLFLLISATTHNTGIAAIVIIIICIVMYPIILILTQRFVPGLKLYSKIPYIAFTAIHLFLALSTSNNKK